MTDEQTPEQTAGPTPEQAPPQPGRAASHARSRRPAQHGGEETIAWSGLPVSEITLESAREQRLGGDDLRIHPQTLEQQASVAAREGNQQLAGSLRLAAELTVLPDKELLALYDLLRPGGASLAALNEAVRLLEDLELPLAAEHVRSAAQWYVTRGLIDR